MSDTEREPTEERWIYAGIRDLNEKRSHCWITNEATGERRYWNGLKGSFVVGGYYTAKVSREDGTVTLHGTPDYAGDYVDTETRSILWAEEHAAKSRLSAKALERRHAKENPVDDALRPIMRLAAKLQVGTEQDAFIAYVERQLRRAMYLPPEKW